MADGNCTWQESKRKLSHDFKSCDLRMGSTLELPPGCTSWHLKLLRGEVRGLQKYSKDRQANSRCTAMQLMEPGEVEGTEIQGFKSEVKSCFWKGFQSGGLAIPRFEGSNPIRTKSLDACRTEIYKRKSMHNSCLTTK
jgi:hypothetical protein